VLPTPTYLLHWTTHLKIRQGIQELTYLDYQELPEYGNKRQFSNQKFLILI
jgi:hypothetical protein